MHRSRLLRIAPALALALLVLALAAELVTGRAAIAIAAALALITAASEAWPWLAGRREARSLARAHAEGDPDGSPPATGAAPCPTCTIDDAPAAEDAFGSYESKAAVIQKLITTERGGRTIGLEGQWYSVELEAHHGTRSYLCARPSSGRIGLCSCSSTSRDCTTYDRHSAKTCCDRHAILCGGRRKDYWWKLHASNRRKV